MTITLPIVGDSDGTWGTILNEALTDLDQRVTTNSTASGGNTSSITGLEGDVADLEGQVASLTTRVTNLENAGGGGGGGGLIVGTTASLPPVEVGQLTLATDTGYLSYGASIGGVATRVPWPGSYLGQFRQTIAQGIPTGSITAGTLLTFNAVDSDRLGAFSGNRYVAPFKGMYEFTGACSFASGTNGFRALCWSVDGTLLTSTRIIMAPAATQNTVIPIRTKPMSLAAGQYVEMYAFQNSGGTIATVVADGTQAPMFNVKYLGYNGT